MAETLTIARPDDFHLHLRDGAALAAVVGHSARQFARAIMMPNLRPPVTTVEQALAYRRRIVAALPAGSDFEPLMTLYLTDATPPAEMRRAREAGIVALKLYPAGATTNSDAGVTDIARTYRTLEAAEREGLALLVHGEVTDPDVDVFDREAVFIERHLAPLRRDLPGLRIVLEHVTTKEGVQYVAEAGARTAATLTAHHLLYNRNALFAGGLRPHYYCLPVLKREEHRRALVAAATSGSERFFLGTDSAPHAAALKEHASGCAGCYTAFSALELYAEAFEAAGALDRLEAFASVNGAAFYGLPRNQRHRDPAPTGLVAARDPAVRRRRAQAAARRRDARLEAAGRPMIDKSPRIALLIDADNSPAGKIGLILNELSTFGESSIRRAYGNWKKDGAQGLGRHPARARDPADPAVRLFQGQERERHGDGHRRARPALHRPSRGLRHRLFGRRLHAAGDAPARQGVGGLRLRRAQDARALRQRLLALPLPRQAGRGRAGTRRRRRGGARATSLRRRCACRPPS